MKIFERIGEVIFGLLLLAGLIVTILLLPVFLPFMIFYKKE